MFDDHTKHLLDFLDARGTVIVEGSSNSTQLHYFRDLLLCEENVTRVAEIGFNAGVSAECFLASRPDSSVVSFDIGDHKCVRDAKDYIDHNYPNRHTLVLGDSGETVPAFFKEHAQECFDLIFIDGGHSFESAYADLINMRVLASERTILIMDDLTPWQPWGRGPCRAWDRAILEGIVHETSLLREGILTHERKGTNGDRIWARGHYRQPGQVPGAC